MDEVSLSANYDYDREVLDSGFGLKVAGKLDRIRTSENNASLESVYGEFLEIFLQQLDFQTASDLVKRIDLDKTIGFDQFTDLQASSKSSNQKSGRVSISLQTSETGGEAICSLIDLMVAAFNPFPSSQ